MGIQQLFGVMVRSYVPLILFSLFPLIVASVCPQGKQFLHGEAQLCINCTVCKNNEVVIRPCEVHRDTHCGLLSDILEGTHHRHKHGQKNYHKHHRKENLSLEDVLQVQPVEEIVQEVKSSAESFSSVETLVWDWQAIALTSAVFACILFFLVITLYSLHQARQWRRLKESFEADVDELSASLMAATSVTSNLSSVEKGDAGVPTSRSGNGSDGNYINKCVYLEQLLNVRKEQKKNADSRRVGGNVYIQEANTSSK